MLKEVDEPSFSSMGLLRYEIWKDALHGSVGRFSVELCQNMEYYKRGFRCEEREEKWRKKKEEDTQYFNKLLEVFSKLFSISNMFEAEVMRYVYQRANPKMTICSVTEIRSFISEIERLGFELDMFLKIRKDDFQGIEELNSGIKKVVNSAKQAYSWFEMNLKTHGIPFLENDELCKMNLKLSELTKELSGSKEKLEKIISAYYNQ